MPYTFDVLGWESFEPDEDGDLRHSGTPTDLDDTHGVIVRAYDPENPDDHHEFIAYAKDFESWAEWWVYIGSLMEMYGMELASE